MAQAKARKPERALHVPEATENYGRVKGEGNVGRNLLWKGLVIQFSLKYEHGKVSVFQ